MMVSQCMEAAKILSQEEIEAKVINISTIKPLDVETIIEAAKETKAIVVAENHNIIGGLGSAVAEALVENYPVAMKRIGIKDTFAECGQNSELLQKYGMSPAHIAQAAQEVSKKRY